MIRFEWRNLDPCLAGKMVAMDEAGSQRGKQRNYGANYDQFSLTDCITTLVDVLATKGRLEIFSPKTIR